MQDNFHIPDLTNIVLSKSVGFLKRLTFNISVWKVNRAVSPYSIYVFYINSSVNAIVVLMEKVLPESQWR